MKVDTRFHPFLIPKSKNGNFLPSIQFFKKKKKSLWSQAVNPC